VDRGNLRSAPEAGSRFHFYRDCRGVALRRSRTQSLLLPCGRRVDVGDHERRDRDGCAYDGSVATLCPTGGDNGANSCTTQIAAVKANSIGRRNTCRKEVAMPVPKQRRQRRRSDQSGRAKLRSPGRPSVGGREDQRRFWAAIARGLYPEAAVADARASWVVGARWFRHSGGMPPTHLAPSAPSLSARYLSFAEREHLALLRVQGHWVRECARRLGRNPSTISLS
jgi:hypothetical protein